ncbi:hypothetical protein Lal_00008049 [Lupinus albus]|nr:hypothetical protein Lal_00008049 [Lupinus albus]
MRFKFNGLSEDGFGQWVARVKSQGSALNRDAYLKLERPSTRNPVMYYATAENGLFDAIVNLCAKPGQMCMKDMMHVDMMGGGGKESEENRKRLEYDARFSTEMAPGATHPASGQPSHSSQDPQGVNEPASGNNNGHTGHGDHSSHGATPAPEQLNTNTKPRTGRHRRRRRTDLLPPLGLSLEGVVHQRRPQEDRHHVCRSRSGHADARLRGRGHDAYAAGDRIRANEGYLPPHHYDQVFTAHGVIMIFFMAMPFVTGIMNYVVPLQIGARDVSFPFLNNFSFWMTTAGAVIIMMSLFIGGRCRNNAIGYQPDRDHREDACARHDHDEDACLHLDIALHQRPDRGTFPILTATLVLLTLDRYVGTHFFTNDLGGNPMMYLHRQASVWLCLDGLRHRRHHHPVLSGLAASLLHHGLWCKRQRLLRHHHDDHLDPDRSEDVQLAVHDVSRPYSLRSAYAVDDRLHADLRHRRHDGRDAGRSPADFVLHNSLFLIAHFHNVIIGGVVFGLLAGVNYWFPKAFGYKLDPFWGKLSFWFWQIGFWFAFAPLYVLGLMGVTRRVNHFEDASLQIWFVIAAFGAFLIALGIASFVIQLIVSFLKRDQLRDTTGDPWDAPSRLRPPTGRLQADPHAEEHRHGRHPVGPQRGACLRSDLVHVVAGCAVLPRHHRRGDRAYLQLQA